MEGKKNHTWDYDVRYLADATNGNSIIAAIGIAQLPRLDEENAIRRKIAAQYDSVFEKYPDKIKLVSYPKDCEPARWLYQIVVDDRDGLVKYLMEKEIGCGIHYPVNTLYWMYADQHGNCVNAEYYSEHIITLPLHIKLTEDEIVYITDCVTRYLGCG